VTLRLFGPGPVDRLDPACAHGIAERAIVRLFSRQLLSYAPHADLRDWQASEPVPDVAIQVPSTYNAGLGASHLGYVIHLRSGVLWDTEPPRRVTAHDFVRGFKRLASPAAPSPARTYFTGTIRGMAEFCRDFAAAVPAMGASAEQLARHQEANEIPGVFALDDETLVIELVRPAPDFIHMLALPCASAAPAEHDAFVPGSPELGADLRSNGPYRITEHVRGRRLTLEPNPAWRPDSDPVRRRHLDRIEVAIEDTGPRGVAARVATGDADLPLASLEAPGGGAAGNRAIGFALDPFLAFNLAGGAPALRDALVRRAISVAVDRAALAERARRLSAGGQVRPARTIVPPGNDAHDPVGSRDILGAGDADRARALLAEAGYGAGLTLKVAFRANGLGPALARSYAADLERAGISVRLQPSDGDDLDRTAWDLAACSWAPDWSYRNGRVFLQPLLETSGSANRGGYSDRRLDELIRQALEAAVEPPAKADAAWSAVERRALEEAAIVPLLFRAPAVPSCCSARVRGAVPLPAYGYAEDLAALWLDTAEVAA
jgi:peptide/nickel transport system substrate-binding protein